MLNSVLRRVNKKRIASNTVRITRRSVHGLTLLKLVTPVSIVITVSMAVAKVERLNFALIRAASPRTVSNMRLHSSL